VRLHAQGRTSRRSKWESMSTSGWSLDQATANQPSWWKLVASDEFTIPALTGSWGTTDANKVVYTGDRGTKWREYPDGWPSTFTNGNAGYAPAKVLSVHDGVLDFHLTDINGISMGANPSPILSSGSQYQAYGKYMVRARFDAVSNYHAAWLLWPVNDSAWQSAESDFPEFDLGDNSVNAFAHYGGSGSQDAFNMPVQTTSWHTYEQIWKPGLRQYYVDGKLVGSSSHSVWSSTERWQLQTEPSSHGSGGSGHVLIDWVAVFSFV
jgi:hypothetical protein